MAKKLSGLLSFILFLVLFTSSVFAKETTPFKVSYSNFYTILPNGEASVKHDIRLINKVSSIYVTDYSFTIFHPDISNVKVSGGKEGEIGFDLKKERKKVEIKVHFSSPVVGLGKSHSFTISYKDKDVSQRTGRVWELNIPVVDKISQMESYEVRIKVPPTFPPLLNSFPKGNHLCWKKENLIGQKGIKVIFGDYQSATLKLRYYLINNQKQEQLVDLALPPDTEFQKVRYDKMNPFPKNVVVDKDGNWLAEYLLPPGGHQKVEVQGKVWIFLNPVFKLDTYLPFDPRLETAATDVWPVDNPEVSQVAASFKTVRQAYKYTLTKLDYSYQRAMSGPDRMGALGALKNPDLAVCMEYTDLFITLARYLGVPAREVNGYAYANNSLLKPLSLNNDVLHAWPEFYDAGRGSWHQVDPTWEDTTGGLDYFYNFDLNHITFVIHGDNPYFPLPAGAYKDKEDNQKEVEVTFTKERFVSHKIEPNFRVKGNLSLNLLDTFIHTGKIPLTVELENKKGEAAYIGKFYFSLTSSSPFTLATSKPVALVLPPFSHQEKVFWLSYRPSMKPERLLSLFKNKKEVNYRIHYNQRALDGHVTVYFNLQSIYQLMGLVTLLGITLFIVTYRLVKRG